MKLRISSDNPGLAPDMLYYVRQIEMQGYSIHYCRSIGDDGFTVTANNGPSVYTKTSLSLFVAVKQLATGLGITA
jgi:hypothetical protein